MKIFYAYNEHFRDMLEMFLNSMKDRWELMEFKIEDFKEKGRMAGGQEADEMRKGLLDYAFSKTDSDEIFVMSDIDIIFYKPCVPVVNEEFEKTQNVTVEKSIKSKSKDIIFQRESMNHGVNMGFMAMKNNQKVKDFWGEVYDISLGKKLWDQPIVNQLVYTNLLKRTPESSSYKDNNKVIWDVFPRKVWNWSIGYADSEICLHHANCAVSKKEKFDQFDRIKEIYSVMSKEPKLKWQI